MAVSQPYRRFLQTGLLRQLTAARIAPSPQALAQCDDVTLVAAVRQGDVQALEVLYNRYARPTFAFALRIVGDPLEAEELLQEAFLRVWQQADRFEHVRGSFPTWLLSITHNLAIDALRRRRRRPQRADLVDVTEILGGEADETVDLEEAASVAELRQRIQAALRALPEPQRQAIELAYFAGLSQREIAEALGEPLGTIKTRLRLGLQKLQEALRGVVPEEE